MNNSIFINCDEKTGALALQRKAREEMKTRLLQDILFDIQVCKIEGWNYKEYIIDLKEIIDDIYYKCYEKII